MCGEMASGGMASVHLGRLLGPAGFSKIVAIKRLHAEFAQDPEFLTMFIEEARLASSINHPNVVSSLDVIAEQDEVLLVMEYVQGETLAQLQRAARQRNTPSSVGIIQRIHCDVLDGLHAAHTASIGGRPLNIVHRDVSPQNIIVGVNGVARVLDFGIAKAESQRQLTRPGRVKGKLAYLSPEQLSGQAVDARTDVFSAGVMLWESLTGERLFASKTTDATVDRVLRGHIPHPSSRNSAISQELDRVVMTALNRELRSRYSSAAEFADALRAVPGEATRAEVSAWVRHAAAEVLARRLAAVEKLEAMDIAQISFSQPPLPTTAKQVTSPAQRLTLARADNEPTVPHVAERGSTNPLEVDKPRAPSRRAALGLGAVLLMASGVGIGIASFARGDLPARRAASSPRSSASAATPVVNAAAATVQAATVEVPVIRLEQLETAPATVARLPAARKPTSVKRMVPPRVAAPAPDCDPPYKIDASGVRRVRFECL